MIGAWNYYSADCLLRCLEYLPEVDDDVDEVAVGGGRGGGRGRKELDGELGGDDGIAIPILRCGNGPMPQVERLGYGTNDPVEETSATRRRQHHHDRMPPPPPGTTAYGRVAWYASGPKGTMRCFFHSSRISYAQPSSGNGSDEALSDLLDKVVFLHVMSYFRSDGPGLAYAIIVHRARDRRVGLRLRLRFSFSLALYRRFILVVEMLK